MNHYDRVYLSPHYDDAAFSCGGTIHRQHRTGRRVLVITIFAAPPDPDEPLSSLARGLHRHMGCEDDPVSIRREEDRSAMARLGAESRRLEFQDCIYRGDPARGEWFYPGMDDVFGPVHPRDEPLARTIADAVETLCHGSSALVFYTPLGIGNHVDHQLTHLAGCLLFERGQAVAFYEDYPYADPAHSSNSDGKSPHSLKAAISAMEFRGATPVLSHLNEADLQARVDSMCAYRSQLGDLPNEAQVIGFHLRENVLRCDPPRMTERFWHLEKKSNADHRRKIHKRRCYPNFMPQKK